MYFHNEKSENMKNRKKTNTIYYEKLKKNLTRFLEICERRNYSGMCSMVGFRTALLSKSGSMSSISKL
ncbi:hypothetical protein SAMN02787100_1068 [Chryseobacterium sp. OV279]|nr:hypothetical protein SAMN02787100_1068 [Chryseobacterium sp. OV279]